MGDVPAFSEFGKHARDILKTGYHYGKGLVKLSFKTKTEKALEISSDFTMNFDETKSNGIMESKYKTKEYGSLTERWTTDGTLTTEYSIENKPSIGYGIDTALNYRPVDSAKSMKLGLKYKDSNFNLGTSITNAFDSNVKLLSSLVISYKKVLVGGELGYNSESGELTTTNIGLAFNIEDVGIHLAFNNVPDEYGVSLSHRINSRWDAAVNGIFATRDDTRLWTVGAGARYKFHEDSTIRLKFNKDLQLGTSLQQKMRDGVKLSVSMHFDCTNPTGGEHKVGFGIEVEA